MPYDRPVVGYGGKTINTLRLWAASSPDYFDFGEFSGGEFFGAVLDKIMAESLTRVLYPDDSTPRGRSLRFLQEYFLVACSLADIVRRFLKRGNSWTALPDKVAIQLNDTHPSMAVAELMRILLDVAHLAWDDAWDLTVRTLAYTNHTLLPEALEKWPVELFELFLPRHLEIIYEINLRFLHDVMGRFPRDAERLRRMSLIEESPVRQVRMANLAIVGTHSTNGVAEIHSRLLREKTVADFAGMFPERFNNKTNGVTPRRWLVLANPDLARLLDDTIGEAWVTDLDRLRTLRDHADDAGFRERFRQAKRAAKTRFAAWVKAEHGIDLDSDSIFDSQVKRIHEYKRQLLNVLHIALLYHRLRSDAAFDPPARTFLFAGKAAPAYRLAKLIIKLINDLARAIDDDPRVKGRIKVVFLPNYSVSLAERLIPASDVSEQISTAGYEASGTSNMKFMMNGALDDRHARRRHDRDRRGGRRGQHLPLRPLRRGGRREPLLVQPAVACRPRAGDARRARPALRRIAQSGPARPLRAAPPGAARCTATITCTWPTCASYVRAQERLGTLYRSATPRNGPARPSSTSRAAAGSPTDRTITEYAREIWNAPPCPVE